MHLLPSAYAVHVWLMTGVVGAATALCSVVIADPGPWTPPPSWAELWALFWILVVLVALGPVSVVLSLSLCVGLVIGSWFRHHGYSDTRPQPPTE